MTIFDHVKYALSSSIPHDEASDLATLLNHNGGVEVPLSKATHVITTTTDFENNNQVEEDCVIVTPTWVARSMILGKMLDPKFYSADPEHIFSGVFATSSGLMETDAAKLIAVLQSFGGQYSTSYTRAITHLITSNTDSPKYKCAMKHKNETNVHVVVPHWYQDCIAAHARLPEDAYEYPNPGVLSGKQLERGANAPNREKMHLFRGLTEDITSGKAEKLTPSSQVWQGRSIFLSPSLAMGEDLLRDLRSDIRTGNGVVAKSLSDADILITTQRAGEEYIFAQQKEMTIGTVEWIRHVHRIGHFTSPTQQPLHYPIPSQPIENFDKHSITVTNYTGPGREYLKRLITVMGGNYTANFTQSNTVVIAAYIGGSKTEKAREWKIPILNHRWLEECFRRWDCIPTAQPEYVDFPEGMDWSQVLADRPLGPVPIEGQTKLPRAFVDNIKAIEPEPRVDAVASASGAGTKKLEDKSPKKLSPAKQLQQRLTGTSRIEAFEVDQVIGDSMRIDDDDDDDEAEASSPIKISTKKKGKGPQRPAALDEERVIDISDDAGLPKTSTPTKATKKLKKNKPVDDEEFVVGKSTPAKASPAKPTKALANAAAIGRSAKKIATPHEEDEEDSDSQPIAGPSKPRPKKKLQKPTFVEELESYKSSSSGEEEVVSPPAKTVTKEKEKSSSSKDKPKVKRPRQEPEDEDVAEPVPTRPKSRLAKKHSKTQLNGKAKKGRDYDSDADDSDVAVIPLPTKTPTKTPQAPPAKKKLKSVPSLASFLDDDASDDELSIQASRPSKTSGRPAPTPVANAKGKRKASGRNEDDEDENIPFDHVVAGPSKKSGGKKKPLVVSSQDQVEDEDIVEPPINRDKGKSRASDVGVEKKKASHSRVPSNVSVPKTPAPKAQPFKSRSSLPWENEGEENEEEEEHEQETIIGRRSGLNQTPSNTAAGRSQNSTGTGTDTGARSRRSAATKAGEKLRTDMQDLNTFQVQMRKGTVRGAWEATGAKTPAKVDKKRSSPDDEEVADGNARAMKKQKTSAAPVVVDIESDDDEVHLVQPSAAKKPNPRPGIIKRFKITTTQVTIDEAEWKILKKLGASMVADASHCTHLVAGKIVRTEKFLVALASVPKIVNLQWIKDCVAAETWLDEKDYLLDDPNGEKKWGIRWQETIRRAASYKNKFLKGHSFVVTKNTAVDAKILKAAIIAHGGEWVSQPLTKRLVQGHSNRHVVSSLTDEHLWASLAAEGIPIYEADFVVSGIMHLELDFAKYRIE